MKQPEDTRTPDMLDQLDQSKRGRGRPKTGDAMTDAERAASYRVRQREKGLVARYVSVDGGKE